MKIVVIGGTGHIGTYLVPRLVGLGHEIVSVSRGQREPYHPHGVWSSVEQIAIDRAAEEAAGTFGVRIREMRPDVVVDNICFTLDSARQLAEALKGQVQHFLHCGTVWVHGHSVRVPTTEDRPRRPFGEYGIQKAAIEEYLLDEARRNGFPATVLHPGHIVGPGWLPVNPAGNFSPTAFSQLAKGEALALPNFGMETVHHVHADDVAQAFEKAITHWSSSVGESFHVVSDAAVTLRGFADEVASWFGKTADVKLLPWEEWKLTVPEQDASATCDHISHSPNCSIEKARRLLEYAPRYSSFQAVYEAVQWLVKHKLVEAPDED